MPHIIATASAAAHPRVGGENLEIANPRGEREGSSPRGRGKQLEGAMTNLNQRLIPAWAGKTEHRGQAPIHRPAHPRVGGENASAASCAACLAGSSPRGRGKPARLHIRT